MLFKKKEKPLTKKEKVMKYVKENSLNQKEKLPDGNPDPQEEMKSIENGNCDFVLWGL